MVFTMPSKRLQKEDNCYLVEGYTDVIQFHQKALNMWCLLQEPL